MLGRLNVGGTLAIGRGRDGREKIQKTLPYSHYPDFVSPKTQDNQNNLGLVSVNL